MTLKAAQLSPDGVYRYTLFRTLEKYDPADIDSSNAVNFIMLNPSTADANNDDPTIRRCMDFAWRWGYQQLIVTNLFALRATNPDALRAHSDPVGQNNDDHIRSAALMCGLIVCAWGTKGTLQGRDRHVVERVLTGAPLHALRLTKGGHPEHPLYIPKMTRPVKFK